MIPLKIRPPLVLYFSSLFFFILSLLLCFLDIKVYLLEVLFYGYLFIGTYSSEYVDFYALLVYLKMSKDPKKIIISFAAYNEIQDMLSAYLITCPIMYS